MTQGQDGHNIVLIKETISYSSLVLMQSSQMAHVSGLAVFYLFLCWFKNGFGIEWKHFHGLAGGPMVDPLSEDLEILQCKNLIFGYFQ